MGTVIFGIILFSALIMYYLSGKEVAFQKRMAQNHQLINIYKGYDDPRIKKLINTFTEKYPFSVEELIELSGKKLENYVEATDDLLASIREYVDQKSDNGFLNLS